jgi:DNA-binding transcriptional MerR regulator
MGRAQTASKTFTTGEAAREIGVSKETLYRYLKELGDVERDRRGDRTWTDADIVRFSAFKVEKLRKKLKK